jgi:hypothetical protein
LYYLRFEVLTAVVMESSILWDITPCILLNFNWRFGGTCRLYLQGRALLLLSRWFLRNVGRLSTV